jgi:hypothetical protein
MYVFLTLYCAHARNLPPIESMIERHAHNFVRQIIHLSRMSAVTTAIFTDILS